MAIQANWQDRSLLLWDERRSEGAALRDYVGQICSDGLLASVAQETAVRLWLPDGQTLASVDVPAIVFSAAEAMDFLLCLPQQLPSDCGDSIRYWTRLARFVIDAIRLERFYPTARRSNAHHQAAWRLHLGQEELDSLERF